MATRRGPMFSDAHSSRTNTADVKARIRIRSKWAMHTAHLHTRLWAMSRQTKQLNNMSFCICIVCFVEHSNGLDQFSASYIINRKGGVCSGPLYKHASMVGNSATRHRRALNVSASVLEKYVFIKYCFCPRIFQQAHTRGGAKK